MVICLYGLRQRAGADQRAEAELFDDLLAHARSKPGFIGYHVYTSDDGEELGVIRFETREALTAWRNDPDPPGCLEPRGRVLLRVLGAELRDVP